MNRSRTTYLSEKIFLLGTFLMILSTQGVMNYFFLSYLGVGELKSYLFEISVVLLAVSFFIKILGTKLKIYTNFLELLLFFYILFSNVLMFLEIRNIKAMLYSFKEVFLFFVLLFIYKNFHKTINKNFALIVNLFICLNILNLGAALFSHYVGYASYTEMLVGTSFYGNVDDINFKVSSINGILRTPALIGSSAAYGYFGLLSYFLISNSDKNNGYLIFPVLNLFLSFTRSVYLGFAIHLFFELLLYLKKKFRVKILLIIKMTLIMVILFITYQLENIYNYLNKLLSSKSLFTRLELWSEIINSNINETFYDTLIGGGYGKIGTANDILNNYIEIVSIFDNSYLFFYYNIGIIGMGIILIYMINFAKKSQKIYFVYISLMCSMFFVNIFQGEAVLSLLPIVLLSIKGSVFRNKSNLEGYSEKNFSI